MFIYQALTQQEYADNVVNCIAKTESSISMVTDIGDGKATIGYGYTFERSNNTAIWQATGISLTVAQWSVLQQIDAATTATSKRSIALSQFTKNLTTTEAKELLAQTYQKYEGPANDLNMPLSWERVAFVSITYNRGEIAVRNKMTGFYDAVLAGNRAEAWYQIRYNAQTTNPDFQSGIAKRRYYESELFGLYDNPAAVTQAEAIAVYRMFTAHKPKIESYEALYGQAFDGALGTQLISGLPPLYAAGRDYNLTPAQVPNDIANELTPAAQVLLAAYVVTPGYGLAADFTALNIQVTQKTGGELHGEDTAARTGSSNDLLIGSNLDNATDYLYGHAGNDVLYGGGGADYLEGGKGNDILNGGAGMDVYRWATGDGNDKIIDPDGGWIVINDGIQDLNAAGHFQETAAGSNVWTRTLPDGSLLTLTHHSPWTLILEDGSTLQLGETQDDFHSGDFGIHLTSAPVATTRTTLTPQADHYARSVVVVEDNTVYGGTGRDWINGNAGDDQLWGEADDDILIGGNGADQIDGGSGNDLLLGQGDNRFRFLAQRPAGGINGNEYDALWSAYSGAITLQTPTLWFDDSAQTYQVDFQYPSLLGAPQGQLVRVQNGGYPYDITLGAWSNDPQDIPADGATDILLGGTGDDTLVGATGTDYLSGGDDHDWLLSYEGNDILDGGQGDDTLIAGGDHDLLSGGEGADILMGEAGDDTLEGGRGQEPLGRRSIASPSGLEMRRARHNRKKTAATAKRKPPPRNSLAMAWQRHELHDMQQMKSIGRSLTGTLHSRFGRSWGSILST